MPKTVTLPTRDGEMKLYDVEPDEPAKGAVIVVQEAFGVNEHIQEVTRRFAAAGFRAVAPHVFHRTGDPVLAYDDLQRVLPNMQAVTKEGLEDDVDATLAYLSDAGFDPRRVGIVGFCMGGSVAFYAAVHYRLGASVTFYGGGVKSGRFGYPSQIEIGAQLQTPWLGLYGDRDQGIPADEVEALRETASAAAVATDVVRYPDAGHGFHCDARDAFHRASSDDAWAKTLDWFETNLA